MPYRVFPWPYQEPGELSGNQCASSRLSLQLKLLFYTLAATRAAIQVFFFQVFLDALHKSPIVA
jgi:hypothetical protein